MSELYSPWTDHKENTVSDFCTVAWRHHRNRPQRKQQFLPLLRCLATVVNKRFHCWLLTYSVHVTIHCISVVRFSIFRVWSYHYRISRPATDYHVTHTHCIQENVRDLHFHRIAKFQSKSKAKLPCNSNLTRSTFGRVHKMTRSPCTWSQYGLRWSSFIPCKWLQLCETEPVAEGLILSPNVN
jgi:hypothetical protein